MFRRPFELALLPVACAVLWSGLSAAEPSGVLVRNGYVFPAGEGLIEVQVPPNQTVVFAASETPLTRGVLLTCTLPGLKSCWWTVVAPGLEQLPVQGKGMHALVEPQATARHLIVCMYLLDDDTGGQISLYADLVGPGPPPNPPTASAPDGVAAEGAGAVRMELRLSKPAIAPVVFEYATADGSAKAGEDYQSTRGRGEIAAGESQAGFEVPILDDAESESEETFSVRFSGITNALPAELESIVTIADDDKPPVTQLAGVVVHQTDDPNQQDPQWAAIMFGDRINDLIGDDYWQPVDIDYSGQASWLRRFIEQTKAEGLEQPHLFLYDYPTRESPESLVWHGPLSKDAGEVEAKVKEYMP